MKKFNVKESLNTLGFAVRALDPRLFIKAENPVNRVGVWDEKSLGGCCLYPSIGLLTIAGAGGGYLIANKPLEFAIGATLVGITSTLLGSLLIGGLASEK